MDSHWLWTLQEVHSSAFDHEDMGFVPLVLFFGLGHSNHKGFVRLYSSIQRSRMPYWIHHSYRSHSWLYILEHQTAWTIRLSTSRPPLCDWMFNVDCHLLLEPYTFILLWLYEWNGDWGRLSLGLWPYLGKEIFWVYNERRYYKTSLVLHRNIQTHCCLKGSMDPSYSHLTWDKDKEFRNEGYSIEKVRISS